MSTIYTPTGCKTLNELGNGQVLELTIINDSRVALVDKEDYEKVSQYKWYISGTGTGTSIYRTVSMAGYDYAIPLARTIMGKVKGMVYDHIDRNFLNNRKSNLRTCTLQQNIFNRGKAKNCISKYKGVSRRDGSKNQWRSRITIDGVSIALGNFFTEKEAAIAYNNKAREVFGEFAYLNVDENGVEL